MELEEFGNYFLNCYKVAIEFVLALFLKLSLATIFFLDLEIIKNVLVTHFCAF